MRCEQTHFPSEVAEMTLAHTVSRSSRLIAVRNLFDRRRRMITYLADVLWHDEGSAA